MMIIATFQLPWESGRNPQGTSLVGGSTDEFMTLVAVALSKVHVSLQFARSMPFALPCERLRSNAKTPDC